MLMQSSGSQTVGPNCGLGPPVGFGGLQNMTRKIRPYTPVIKQPATWGKVREALLPIIMATEA